MKKKINLLLIALFTMFFAIANASAVNKLETGAKFAADLSSISSETGRTYKVVFEGGITNGQVQIDDGSVINVDEGKEGKIKMGAYFDSTDSSGHGYIIKIWSTDGGKIYLNEDSSHMFSTQVKKPETDEFYDPTVVSSIVDINFGNDVDSTLVTNMKGMFYGAKNLKSVNVQKLSTGNVTDMSYMFHSCESLETLDVSGFNTAKVTTMRAMFYGCKNLQQLDVSHFNTANVTNMASMFYGANHLEELDVQNFDTGNVTNMSFMFYGCKLVETLDVSKFNTAKVTTMEAMFYGCEKVKALDVSHFDTANVTNMSFMFYYCFNVNNLDLSHFNTAKVTTMKAMFIGVPFEGADFSSFNTSNVTNMEQMFFSCTKLKTLDLSNFDTSKVTTMQQMFHRNLELTSIKIPFNTKNVTNMLGMFEYCPKLTCLDLSTFDTSKVTTMRQMFFNDTALRGIKASDTWTVAGVTAHSDMFTGDKNLVGGTTASNTPYDSSKIDKTYAVLHTATTPGYLTAVADWNDNVCVATPEETPATSQENPAEATKEDKTGNVDAIDTGVGISTIIVIAILVSWYYIKNCTRNKKISRI